MGACPDVRTRMSGRCVHMGSLFKPTFAIAASNDSKNANTFEHYLSTANTPSGNDFVMTAGPLLKHAVRNNR